MRRLRRFWQNIPRKAKIVCNFLLTAVLIFWCWLLAGSPTGIENIYRRMEQANLVGPGEILAILKDPGCDFEYLVLGEAGNSATAYFHDKEDSRRNVFVCLSREEGMAMVTFPADNMPRATLDVLPVFLLDWHPEAQRAELMLSLPDGSARTEILQSARESDGYFRFSLDTAHTDRELVDRLRLLSGNTMADRRRFSLCAQVRLYDGNNALLQEIQWTLQ